MAKKGSKGSKGKKGFEERGTISDQPTPNELPAIDYSKITVPENLQTTQPKADKVPQPDTQLIRNQDTGDVTGIKKGDKIFLGANKRDQRELYNTAIQTQKANPQAAPIGEAAQIAAVQQNANASQEAINTLGQQVAPTPEVTDFSGRVGTDTALNVGGLVGATGIAAALPTLASSIGGGAAAGSVVPVAGTIVGAGIGLLAGIGFILGRVALSRRNVTKRAYNVFKESTKSNTYILNLANAGQTPPDQIVNTYNQNLANIIAARDELRRQTRTKTGKSLSGAQEELADIEIYLRDETLRRQVLINAIQRPNPNLIYPVEQDLNTNEQ